jgi:hypothetical protein
VSRRFGSAAGATPLGIGGLVLGIGGLVLGLGACGPSNVSPGPVDGTPTIAPTIGPASRVPTSTSSSGVEIDRTLLAILPASVDGLPIAENAEAEAATLGDPLLEQVASAFASGFAIEPASGDFVYAVVVELLPDALDETVFRDWRDTYNEGACSQADGILGNAETEIDGRTVYIGTCAGGLRTYHVWLEDRGVLISASAVGERRLGELLVENLRP